MFFKDNEPYVEGAGIVSIGAIGVSTVFSINSLVLQAEPAVADTITLDLSLPTDKAITIDWGDGQTTDVTGPVATQAYTNSYASAGAYPIKFIGDKNSVTYLDVEGVKVSGSLSDLPSGLTNFACRGANTLSGSLSDLPSGLTNFVCYGANIISGDLSGLPSELTYFVCNGQNTISGSLSGLPSELTIFVCSGSNTIDAYTSFVWTTKITTFIVEPVSPGGLSESEIDQLLVDLDDDFTWSYGTITLTGTNASPSAVGDAAIANMVSEGVTITTN